MIKLYSNHIAQPGHFICINLLLSRRIDIVWRWHVTLITITVYKFHKILNYIKKTHKGTGHGSRSQNICTLTVYICKNTKMWRVIADYTRTFVKFIKKKIYLSWRDMIIQNFFVLVFFTSRNTFCFRLHDNV